MLLDKHASKDAESLSASLHRRATRVQRPVVVAQVKLREAQVIQKLPGRNIRHAPASACVVPMPEISRKACQTREGGFRVWKARRGV